MNAMNPLVEKLRKITISEDDDQEAVFQAADYIDELLTRLILVTEQRDKYLGLFVDVGGKYNE